MREKMININRRFILTLLTFAILGITNSCNQNDEWNSYYKNIPNRTNEKILDLISKNENYSKFYNALNKYGFDDLLSENQYFTLFVPINSAFEGLPEYSKEEWTKIIGFHISYSKLYSR